MTPFMVIPVLLQVGAADWSTALQHPGQLVVQEPAKPAVTYEVFRPDAQQSEATPAITYEVIKPAEKPAEVPSVTVLPATYDTDLPLDDPGFFDFRYIPWWAYVLAYLAVSLVAIWLQYKTSWDDEGALREDVNNQGRVIGFALAWPFLLALLLVIALPMYMHDRALARADQLAERHQEQQSATSALLAAANGLSSTQIREFAAELAERRNTIQESVSRVARERRRVRSRAPQAEDPPVPGPPATDLSKLEV